MSLHDTAQGMADELTGAVVIGAMTTGDSPLARLDSLAKVGDDWNPEYVEAATEEFRSRSPQVEATDDEIAHAIYDATAESLRGSF